MQATMRQLLTGTSLLCALAMGAPALAQAPPTMGPPTASARVNPYANPYANPFLNPALMANGGNGTVNQSNAWMYLWAANQQSGGIGSGRLSTSRPSPSPSQPQEPRLKRGRAAAEMPVSLKRPGGAASHYFNRGMGAVDPQRSAFGRQNRYFKNNGR